MSGKLKPCPFCGGEAQRYTVMRGFENRQVCCKSCGASAFDLKWDRATTPSQGLDAATVERCADVAFVAAMKAGRGLEQAQQDVAFVRRALATDPHQHGGKA